MKYFEQETLGQGEKNKICLFFKNLRCLLEIHLLLSIKQLNTQYLEFYGEFKDVDRYIYRHDID